MRNYIRAAMRCFSFFLLIVAWLGFIGCGSPELPPPAGPEPVNAPVVSQPEFDPDSQQIGLHLIIIADSEDISIGPSTQIDLRNMRKLMGAVAEQSLNRIVLKPIIRDERVTQQELMAILEGVQPRPNDVIVFHWAGHGHGAPGAKWPYLDTAGQSTDFSLVFKILSQKKARQVIALADCCNAPLIDTRDMFAAERPLRKFFFPESIAKLFILPRIKIIASGSETGQYASGTNSLGGYFTYNFLTTLEEALLAENIADSPWESVMQTTRERVMYDTSDRQAPQYAVNPAIGGGFNEIDESVVETPVDEDVEPIEEETAPKDSQMPKDFNQLLDKILDNMD